MMNRQLLFSFVFCLSFLFVSTLHAAQWVSGTAIAMHGAPKLPEQFDHFPYVNPDAPKGGLMRLNIVGTFDSLNPFIVKGRPAEGMTYVYEPLMARSQDEPFTLYPLIAEKIDVMDDRSAIRFHINPAARWQDGEKITADDVLFSWQTLRDKGRPNFRSYYKKVLSAEKNDALTITFTFRKDEKGTIDRELPLIMGLMTVLPKHMWEKGGFDVTSLAPPVGSGPYKMTKVDAGRSTSFTRDPHYWGRDLPSRKGTCNFDVIRYDYYRDENVAQEAFTAGQIDARRETDPKRWDTLQRVEKEKPGTFRTYAFKHSRPEPMRAFIFNARRPLFAARATRHALSVLFDFDWINRTLYHGDYKRTLSYFSNSELAATGLPSADEVKLLQPFRDQLPPEIFTKPFTLPQTDDGGPSAMRPYIKEAIELFGDEGYQIQNQIMVDRKGKPVTFEILLSDPQDEKVALEYTRMLARIGVVAHVRTVDAAQFQSRLNDFDYDVILYKWINSLSPGNEQQIYWGSAAADQKGSRNYAGIKNPAIDALIQKMLVTTTREELVTAIHAMDRVLLWNDYVVPLFYRGTDLFAIWNTIAVPETVPLYGPVVESWWSSSAGKP